MVKAWLNPAGDLADLENEVGLKSTALENAAKSGFRFLALPVENIRDSATWILASFHSPITVVPLPPHLPLPALEARLAQLPRGEVVFPSSLKFSKPDGPPPTLRPLDEVWAVVFTSGSSGEPKGVALQGSALRASAFAHAEHLGTRNACWLLDLPLYHIGGLSVLSRALFLDAKIALGPSRFDATETANWIRSGLVQGLSLVPTTLFRLLKEECLDFSPLKVILLGGAPAEPSLVTAARARGAPVFLTYGMSEHSSQIATEKSTGEGLEALPGVDLRIDPDGEILVRSTCLAKGFYRDSFLHPIPLLGGFYPTGDLGELRGKHLTIMGRKSDLIITGGMKVFPLEVEKEIARLPGILDCAVIALPDQEWGEILCAAVSIEEPQKFNLQMAREMLAQRLEARKIPRRWEVVSLIPRSANGKILRAELRGLISGLKPIRN